MSRPRFDPRRSLVALDQHTCPIAVVELSQSTWLVGAIVPCIERDPLKRLTPPDPEWLLKLLYRWRDEAIKAGKMIERIVVGYEAGATGSGWRGGCLPEALKRTSCTRRA
jgi:transposase